MLGQRETDIDTYLVILTVDNDVDHAVYVHASDCESAFVEAAKLYPRSHVQPRVAQLIAETSWPKIADHNYPAGRRSRKKERVEL
jgi:hypothetical protein